MEKIKDKLKESCVQNKWCELNELNERKSMNFSNLVTINKEELKKDIKDYICVFEVHGKSMDEHYLILLEFEGTHLLCNGESASKYYQCTVEGFLFIDKTRYKNEKIEMIGNCFNPFVNNLKGIEYVLDRLNKLY